MASVLVPMAKYAAQSHASGSLAGSAGMRVVFGGDAAMGYLLSVAPTLEDTGLR
jgi:hypothetical protein